MEKECNNKATFGNHKCNCKKDGKYTNHATETSKCSCINNNHIPEIDYYGKYGWICPVCGRVNAPWVSYCPCNDNNNNWDWGIVWCNENVPYHYHQYKGPLTISGEYSYTTEQDIDDMAETGYNKGNKR